MLQYVRRRDLILLLGLFALALLTVFIVLLLILQSQPVLDPAVVASAQSGPPPTHTVTPTLTGLGQFQLAQAEAVAWAADAQLVAASANWPQVLRVDEVGAATRWTYRFHSPKKRRLYIVVVEPDGVTRTVEHAVRVTLPPRPISPSSWAIDSPAALARWLDAGGAELLRTNPGLEIVAQLRTVSYSADPVWMVIGLDSRTDDLLIVPIDGRQGQILPLDPDL